MPELSITIACEPYDRVRAIMDGSVRVEGCSTTFLPLRAEETFYRALGNREFEVCELSLSSYMLAAASGVSNYVAVPVFLSRTFRHSAIYIRADRGIESPSDLLGRLVGVPEYQMTAALWVRGLLSDQYRVKPHEIRWRTGGLEMIGRSEKVPISLPAQFDIAPIPGDQTLSGMLAEGELDAIVTARAPSSFMSGEAPIIRLFPDFRTYEEAYFKETQIFPIMHVLAVRKDVIERNPWLPSSLYKAFSEAKASCIHHPGEVGTLSVTLPWVTSELEATRKLMGNDYWPYGVQKNRKVLEHAIRYSQEQGLIGRPLSVEELFAPGTVSQFTL